VIGALDGGLTVAVHRGAGATAARSYGPPSRVDPVDYGVSHQRTRLLEDIVGGKLGCRPEQYSWSSEPGVNLGDRMMPEL
jgi:hypothetical protein